MFSSGISQLVKSSKHFDKILTASGLFAAVIINKIFAFVTSQFNNSKNLF